MSLKDFDIEDFLEEQTFGRAVRYTMSHKANPYVVEFVMSFTRYLYIVLGFAVIALGAAIFHITLDYPSFDMVLVFVYTVGYVAIVGFFLYFLLGLYSDRALIGFFIERIKGRTIITKRVTFVEMGVKQTTYAFGRDVSSAIDSIFPREYIAAPIIFTYKELSENATPKKSPKKKEFDIYTSDRFRPYPKGKGYKDLNWILTTQKCDVLNEMMRLEPTAEYEIDFTKHSNLLLEIRPIEGWEYAEGVPELCEKISKMYP